MHARGLPSEAKLQEPEIAQVLLSRSVF